MLSHSERPILKQILTCWDRLSAAQQDLVMHHAASISYRSQDSLYCANNDCMGMLLIKRGTLRVYILSEQGKEITLYRLNSGDVCVLSAACVLKNITFDVHIDAETDCEIIQISAAIVGQLTETNIYWENFTYKVITQRFSDVMWAMQQILFFRLDQRLAAFLLSEAEKASASELHLTHEQIAKNINSAREAVSRMLKYFAREGFVTLAYGDIKLVDKDKLQSLCK